MNLNEVKTKIMDFMQGQTYAPLDAETLILQIPIPGEMLKEFWQSLKELESNGNIVKTHFNTYGLPEKMGLVVGRFQLTSKGFGFVIPDNKGEKPDVFVPPNALNGAMNNDRIMARVSVGRGGQKPEGEVIRIITHANARIVGTFVPSGEFGFVVPDDKRIGQDIYIASKNFNGVKNNQKVVAEIITWPEGRRSAEGKVVEILGTIGDVGLEIISIIKQNDLPLEFPEKVLAAASKIPKEIKQTDIKGRRDKRNYSLVTVDGEDAKDLDDAIYVEKQGNDFLLGVYIADVSSYVQEDSIIDKEAHERGTSVYLVDRVLPMLPEKLSNGICSLNAGEDRLAMSCEMLVDGATGMVKSYEIFPAVIKVLHRLSYTIVREIVANDNLELKEKYADIVPMLKNMETLCKILRAKRTKRGAIDFDLPEQKVILDEQKKPVEIVQRIRSIAESIVEEFMLAANETVAEHMNKQKWPFVYRVHDVPNESKMVDLAKLLHNFAINLPLSTDEDIKPLVVQQALAQMEGRPEKKLVETVALRSLKQAVYQTDNIGHFGLAAKYYTHFTSPIRRYPDLIVHRLLRAWMLNPKLQNKQREILEPKLDEICQNSSVRERAAAEAERATVDLKKAEYMVGLIGEEFDGTISGVTAFGMFIELENGVEGLIHISSLTDDYYEFVEDQYHLIGEHLKKIYRLGDKVRVEVLQVSIADRAVDFILAGANASTRDHLKAQIDYRRESGEKKRSGGAYFSKGKKQGKDAGKTTHKKDGKKGKSKKRR